jgi:hypothetical protein
VAGTIGSHGRSRLVVASLASDASDTCGGLLTDDHTSAESRSQLDDPPTKADDQTEQGWGSRIKKILKKLLKGWRALAFLLIVFIVAHYAFHYKGLSDPGSESKQLASHAPQEVDFFVSNSNVSVGVSVFITPYTQTGPFPGTPESPSAFLEDQVTVTGYAPSYIKNATILMLTNRLIPGSAGLSEFPLETLSSSKAARYSSSAQSAIDGDFAFSFPGRLGVPVTVGEFPLTDLQQTNAYLYGHLPAIGTVDESMINLSTPPRIVLAERYNNPSDRIRDVVLDPNTDPLYAQNITDLKSYRTPYGGPGELFYTPANLSITETQSNLALTIAHQQLNYMTPGGQISGSNYTWHGSTSLEPVFQATNGDALKNESDSAFLSGVLFGVAGAAVIAFVQEVPKTLPQDVWRSWRSWRSRRKRNRESSSQSTTGEKPDSTEGEKKEVETKAVSKTAKSSTGLGWPRSD